MKDNPKWCPAKVEDNPTCPAKVKAIICVLLKGKKGVRVLFDLGVTFSPSQ